MREKKFKVWDKRTKQMCCVVEIRIDSMVYLKPKIGHPFYRDIIDVDLLDYIGLKDKNGKEIWEGDIIKRENAVASVIWDYDGWYIDIELFHSAEGLLGDVCHVLWGQAEVVGNIYENPELLEETKCGGEKA